MANPLLPIAVTANTTLDWTVHGGTTLVMNKADGFTITLPAASGSGVEFEVLVGTTISSNSGVIQVANASDTMYGVITSATTTTGAGTHEAAGGTDDTITMNGTTTGGIAGSRVKFKDVAANKWLIAGLLVGSGSLASPLSAAVS